MEQIDDVRYRGVARVLEPRIGQPRTQDCAGTCHARASRIGSVWAVANAQTLRQWVMSPRRGGTLFCAVLQNGSQRSRGRKIRGERAQRIRLEVMAHSWHIDQRKVAIAGSRQEQVSY